jgi:antitoxin component YwqK of YwqJK toxin-antitoxin module
MVAIALALLALTQGTPAGEVQLTAPLAQSEGEAQAKRQVSDLHPNGVVAAKGMLVLVDGEYLEQGLWESFGVDGAPLSRGEYELGRATGEWTFWHALSAGDEPALRLRCAYEDGLLHGRWWSSHPGPKAGTAETGSYAHGEPNSSWCWWWPDGTPRGNAVYENGELDGPFEVFHASGDPAESGKYAKGVRDGAWTTWHENGQLALYETWSAGLREGSSKSYYLDGVLESEGTYRAGGREGLWSFFHADGSLAERGEFGKGRAQGPWKSWYPGGAPEAEGSYVDGLADGDWVTWDAEGQVLRRMKYARGRELAAPSSGAR